MERRLFGTDGIRGLANMHPMTAEVALALGKAAGRLFQRGDRLHNRSCADGDRHSAGPAALVQRAEALP